jgi:hypothetical protein
MANVPGASAGRSGRRTPCLTCRPLLGRIAALTLISSCLAAPVGQSTDPAESPAPQSTADGSSLPTAPAIPSAPVTGMLVGWYGKANAVNGGGFTEIFSGGSATSGDAATRPDTVNATLDWVQGRFGRPMSLVHMYESAGDTADFPLVVATETAKRHQCLMVSLSFGPMTALQLAAGDGDSRWRNWAQGAKQWGKPVILRWGWEAPIQPWARDATAYKAAWSRMWHIVKADVGATNVQLAFTPVYGDTGWGSYRDYFPGDRYVDWVGVDDYQPPAKGFEDTFKSAYDWFSEHAPGKPFMVAEWGMKREPDTGGPPYDDVSSDWYGRTLEAAKTHPNIKAYVLYDNDQEIKSALGPDQPGMVALKAKLQDPYYLRRSPVH